MKRGKGKRRHEERSDATEEETRRWSLVGREWGAKQNR